MAIRLGDTAPDFTAESTSGPLNLYDYLDGQWGIIFSHPADFTPVCTTELGALAKLKSEFDKRRVRILALSVDPLEAHYEWIKDINETQQTNVNFPVIADPLFVVCKLYDLVHPAASEQFTVRSVIIIGPDKKVKLMITYPASTGRNFEEIIRVVDSLQLTATYSVATPANWRQGDDVVIAPSVRTEDIPGTFPKGAQEIKPYLRVTPQPDL